PLGLEDQDRVRAALTRAVGLKPEVGDSLQFGLKVAPAQAGVPIAPPVAATGIADYRPAAVVPQGSSVWLFAMAAIVGILLIAFAVRARSPAISTEQRDLMVLRIRRQLSLMVGTGDARS
ncbi:MAG: hypothetical protein QOJ27_61, partial [Sphingomonadales bacterium]|nr:hypothetical protein [Sphingomonadales bacterium]